MDWILLAIWTSFSAIPMSIFLKLLMPKYHEIEYKSIGTPAILNGVIGLLLGLPIVSNLPFTNIIALLILVKSGLIFLEGIFLKDIPLKVTIALLILVLTIGSCTLYLAYLPLP